MNIEPVISACPWCMKSGIMTPLLYDEKEPDVVKCQNGCIKTKQDLRDILTVED